MKTLRMPTYLYGLTSMAIYGVGAYYTVQALGHLDVDAPIAWTFAALFGISIPITYLVSALGYGRSRSIDTLTLAAVLTGLVSVVVVAIDERPLIAKALLVGVLTGISFLVAILGLHPVADPDPTQEEK